jgi:hypothetical protein
MLSAIHTSITALLRTGEAAIGPDEAQVLFRAPERGWPAGLDQPALIVYLFELRENRERREPAPQLRRSPEGAARVVPPRQFDLHYLVCAFAADPTTEYDLLWRALALLQRHAADEGRLRLADALAIPVRLEDSGELRTLDLWTSLGVTPRPALRYVATAPLDLALVQTPASVYEASIRFDFAKPTPTAPPARSEPAMPPDPDRPHGLRIIDPASQPTP